MKQKILKFLEKSIEEIKNELVYDDFPEDYLIGKIGMAEELIEFIEKLEE